MTVGGLDPKRGLTQYSYCGGIYYLRQFIASRQTALLLDRSGRAPFKRAVTAEYNTEGALAADLSKGLGVLSQKPRTMRYVGHWTSTVRCWYLRFLIAAE